MYCVIVRTILDLLRLVEQDYIHNERRSFKTGFVLNRMHILSHIDGAAIAEQLGVTHIKLYITQRRSEGAKNSTINRELSTLRRAYNLGLEEEKITRAPVIKALVENNVREGFVEWGEFELVKSHLELRYRRPYIFGFYNGWRRGEILSLKKECVDLATGVIRLSKKLSKNNQGRIVVVTGECLASLREAFNESQSAYVFSGPQGHARISGTTFYTKTKQAFAASGVPERRVHDLRRSAYRNLLRAGNHDKIARQFTGHKSRAMADRYDIVDEDDILAAAKKMQQYVTLNTSNVQSDTPPITYQALNTGAVPVRFKYIKSLLSVFKPKG